MMGALVVFGYGPGVSHAVAERFGRDGRRVALVGRNTERLADGVTRLRAGGVDATAYQGDAGDPAVIRATIARIRVDLDPVSTLVWTAFRGGDVTDVLAARPEEVGRVFDVGVTGLLTCVQELLEDLKSGDGAAVLVANGSVGEHTSDADGFAVRYGIDGVGLENAAKSKLVGILAERLREFGVYVGEVTIAGTVAGTATASPTAIAPAAIADRFWSLARHRDQTRVRMTE